MAAPPEHCSQPTTYKVSLKSVLSLPFRICNPPPAVGKVRSCGVTPLLNVCLDDVLDRKHLPPLGLKDFEEWLLYVEMCPENLYFILWLREYRARYIRWAAQTQLHRDSNAGSQSKSTWSSHNATQLAIFYARAKQTFFTPNAEYELNLESDLLAPFHKATESTHPDPAIFTDVAVEIQRMLEDSLRRFVAAQLNNVGNNRVLCGMIAGIVICLLGAIPPLAVNFVHGGSRWLRLTAFPGVWFGLFILFSALHGICVGIYIFGDLRQLRKFELARPPISKPKPLPDVAAPEVSNSMSSPALTRLPMPSSSRQPIIAPPPYVKVTPSLSRISTSSSTEESYAVSESSHQHCGDDILISPAFYDTDIIDGPATTPITPGFNIVPAEPQNCQSVPFPATAGFIHPYVPAGDDDYTPSRSRHCSSSLSRQPLSTFDFDSLPIRAHSLNYETNPSQPPATITGQHKLVLPTYHGPPLPEPATVLTRIQAKCTIESWRMKPGYLEPKPSPASIATSSGLGSKRSSQSSIKSEKTRRGSASEEKIRKRFRMVRAVPAFKVPLTRVLNPIIVRGQWEIVVRSALLAVLFAWILVGLLVAVPVLR